MNWNLFWIVVFAISLALFLGVVGFVGFSIYKKKRRGEAAPLISDLEQGPSSPSEDNHGNDAPVKVESDPPVEESSESTPDEAQKDVAAEEAPADEVKAEESTPDEAQKDVAAEEAPADEVKAPEDSNPAKAAEESVAPTPPQQSDAPAVPSPVPATPGLIPQSNAVPRSEPEL
ncbi:MAG: hypothetical protein KVP17_000049 [Porospora cf. gigantea B]|uniref:uncharacterized protein n=1 Tax=Porospora cf. gigantea B TaxID=2853592 RepID=UPI003571CC67|nr:MAG: hypothetical protein KVP17_000049 [Porospora cf. gigantea B]